MEKKTITIEYDDYSNENLTLDEALKLIINIENESDAIEKATPDNAEEITDEQMIKVFSIMATARSAAILRSKLKKENNAL
jgi:hypothetical protein